MKYLGQLFAMVLFTASSLQAAAGRDMGKGSIYIGPDFGVTKYSNLGDGDAVPSTGVEFGFITESGIGLGGFLTVLDATGEFDHNSEGNTSTSYSSSANINAFGGKLAYYVASGPLSFHIGVRAGVLAVRQEASTEVTVRTPAAFGLPANSSTSMNKVDISSNDLLVGPVAGFQIHLADFISLGGSIAWESTVGRKNADNQSDNISRIDPRFEVRFHF